MNWQYFSFDDFKCSCGCGRNEISLRVVDDLDAMRREVGFPIVISSGYRCPEYNNKISKSGFDGPHTTGLTVDISVYGERAFEILSVAKKFGFKGIGIKQTGKRRFLHLDQLKHTPKRPRPWVWSYS